MTSLENRLRKINLRMRADADDKIQAEAGFNELLSGNSEYITSVGDDIGIALQKLCQVFQVKLPLNLVTDLSHRDPIDIVSDAGLIANEISLAKLDQYTQGIHRNDLGPLLVVELDDDNKPINAWACIRKQQKYCFSPECNDANVDQFLVKKKIYAVTPKLPAKALSLKEWLLFGMGWLKPELSVFALLTLASGVLAMALPILTATIIDTVVPDNHQTLLVQISLVLIVIVVFQGLASFMVSWIQCRMDIKNDIILQAAIIDRVLAMVKNSKVSPSILAMQSQSAMQCRKAIHSAVLQIANGFSYLLSASILMLIYQPAAAAIVLAGMLLLICILIFLGVRRQQVLREGQLLDMSSNDKLFDILGNISLIRSFGLERHFFSQWVNSYSIMRSKLLRAKSVFNVVPALEKSWPYLLLTLGYGAAALSDGIKLESQGQFLSFITALASATAGLSLFSGGLQKIFISLPMTAAIRPILNFEPARSHLDFVPILSGDISVSHVSLYYVNQQQPALYCIDINIKAGEYIGIVGFSGSGKSSLIRTLLGLEKPSKGAVLFDGANLEKIHASALRRHIGIVMQDQQLLPGSLYDNISGLRSISIEAVWAAAEKANIAGDIQQLPMGMFTMVGDVQSVFSGGQIQRILLARALAVVSPIIILDEATSALDRLAQSQVCRNLAELKNTRIVVAHRLATVQLCDRIIVMHKGAVDSIGSWQELESKSVIFQKLVAQEFAQ